MSHSGSEVPRRPRLLAGLPVLRRGDDGIQLGLDPRHAVVIEGVTKSVAESIRKLDGGSRTKQLLDQMPPDERPALAGLLRELHGLGLIEDMAAGVPHPLAADATIWALRTNEQPGQLVALRQRSSVLVHGSGRLGIAVANLLVTAGVGTVEVDADGMVEAEDIGTGYRTTDIGRTRRAAAKSITGDVRVARPDLVVLTDAAVPEPEYVAELLTESVPHLAVRVREGIGIVGPFVVPGRSSCLGCADLHRADRDTEWPTVAAQLVGQAQPADLAGAHATAALAVEQAMRALAWLASGGRQPPVWNATMELDPFHGKLEYRPWPPHVFCACGAH